MPAPHAETSNTWELIRLARAGDREALDRLVAANQGLVTVVSAWYHGRGLAGADLKQEGNIGLLRAIATFDPAKGKWSDHAVSYIRAVIEQATVDAGTVRAPRHVVMLRNQVKRGKAVEMTPRRRKLVEKAARGCEEMGYGGRFVPDHRPPVVEAVDTMDELESLSRGFDSLDRAERELLSLRYGLDGGEPMSFAEIAEQVGISKDWARIIVGRAETRLRAKLTG